MHQKHDKFGQQIQMDHIGATDLQHNSIRGDKVSLQLSDDYSGFRAAYPSPSKDEGSVLIAFRHFIGRSMPAVKCVRSDCAPELIAAMQSHPKILHVQSIPHAHQSNSKRE